MIKTRLIAAAVAMASTAGVLGGCAVTSTSLMDDKMPTAQMEDPTSLEPNERLAFVVSEDNRIRLHLHVGNVKLSGSEFTRIGLIFSNRGGASVTIRPSIVVTDQAGAPIVPLSAGAVQKLASNLLRRAIAPLPAEQVRNYYGSEATANGAEPDYGDAVATQPAAGLSVLFPSGSPLGAAVQTSPLGATVQATLDRNDGEALIVWLEHSFLRKEYVVAAGDSAAGSLLLRVDPRRRPLSVSVQTGVSTHVFSGIGAAP